MPPGGSGGYLQVLVGCKRLNVLCLQELVVALHRQVHVDSVYYMAHCLLCTSFCTSVDAIWMKSTGAATFLQTVVVSNDNRL